MEDDAHVDQSPNPVGPEQAEVPGNEGAPIVAHEEDPIQTKCVQEGYEVADDVEDGVTGGGGRRVGVAVAAEVGGDGTVAAGGSREHLVAPRVPELREAVEEEHRRAGARLRNVHVYAVDEDCPMLYLLHLHLSLSVSSSSSLYCVEAQLLTFGA